MKKAALLLASSLTVMSGALVAPALPAIAGHFAEVPRVDFLTKLILTLPALGIVVGAPAAGWWLDRNPRRPVLLAALIGYAAVGSLGFVLPDLYALLASRLALGLTVAVILPTSVTLVGEYFDGAERTRFLGTQSAFMALGGTVFVAISGGLASLGWRYVFLVYASALLVAALAWRALPEPTRPGGEATPAGEPAGSRPPLSGWVWFTYACVLLGMVAFYLIPVQNAFVLAAVGVEAEWLLGAGLIVGTLAAAGLSASYGWLRARFTATALFAVAFAGMGVGFAVIGLLPSLAGALAGSVVAGAGAGVLMPNGNACLIEIAPPARRGTVLGGLTTVVFAGQFLSPIALQPVIDATGGLLAGHLAFGLGCLGVAAAITAVAVATRGVTARAA